MRKKIVISTILAIVCCLSCFLFSACKKKYTISFEANGGAQIAAVQVTKGESYTLPEPKKEGYEFLGWYINADFSGAKTEVVTPDGNMTVYAKWRQTAKVELDAKGGTLSKTEVTAAVGQKVMPLIEGLTPTKNNAEFYAWYNGEKRVNEDTKVPEAGLKLSAVYKYKYTVTVRIASKDDESVFEVDATRGMEGYELEGKNIKAEKFSGLTLVGGESGAIKADAENSFTFDYKRDKVTVNFNSNYPEGESEVETVEATFGDSINAPKKMTYMGYLFLGWSTERTGKVDYPVYIEEGDIFNYDKESLGDRPQDKAIIADGNATLYGRWLQGRINMVAGADCIFLIEEEVNGGLATYAYLYRGGVYYRSNHPYNAQKKAFQFDISGSGVTKVVLGGYIIDEKNFVYTDENRAGTYKRYSYEFKAGLFGLQASGVINDKITLEFNKQNGVIYREYADKDGNDYTEPKASTGSYIINEGVYEITFTDGEKAGQIMHCARLNYGGEKIFLVRNDEEYGKKYYRYVVNKNQLMIDEKYGYYLLLDGYGTAVYVAQQSQQFIYNYEGEFMNLFSSSGGNMGAFRIVEQNGVMGYTAYTSELDRTYRNGDETLILDGSYKAEYIKGSIKNTGMFTLLGESALGGYLVEFCDANEETTHFIVKSTKNADKTYTHSFEEVDSNYAELTYVRGQNKVSDRIIIINGERASIYGVNTTKQYIELASGTLSVVDGKYTLTIDRALTADQITESELISAGVEEELQFFYEYCNEFADVETIEFETNTSYGVFYFTALQYKTEAADVNEGTVYTDVNGGNGRLKIYGNRVIFEDDGETVKEIALGVFAVFTDKDGETYSGILAEAKTYTVFSATVTIKDANGNQKQGAKNFGFDLDKEGKTFLLYDYLPIGAYVVDKNGNRSSAERLELDGKGGATYTITTTKTVDGKEQTEESVINGTIAKTGENISGIDVYKFKATEGDEEFEAIIFSAGSYNAFAKKSNDFVGDYTIEVEGVTQTLTLDGYILAKLSSEEGTSGNMYYFTTDVEDQIMIIFSTQAGSYTYYIDLNRADNTFNIRGTEYGEFLYLENQSIKGMWFELDGYGTPEDYELGKAHAVIKDYERDEHGNIIRYDEGGNPTTDGSGNPKEVTISDSASYKIDKDKDGKTYVYIKYTKGSDTINYKGILTTVSSGSRKYAAFVEVKTEVEKTYINETDWSMLILTSYGVARKIDGATGVISDGSYTLITEHENGGLLYFVPSEGDSGIYVFDTERGTLSKKDYKHQGYYTEELYSFYFSDYGYATYAKGDEKKTYFYDTTMKDGKEIVTLYYQDWFDAEHNDYGFVTVEDFGEHIRYSEEAGSEPKTKEWMGDKFYPTNDAEVVFAREEATKLTYAHDFDAKTKLYFSEIRFTPNGNETFSLKANVKLVDKDGNPYKVKDDKGNEVDAVYSGTIKREKLTRYEGEGDSRVEKEYLRCYLQIPADDGGNYQYELGLTFKGQEGSSYKVEKKEWELTGSGHYYNEGMRSLYMTIFQGGNVDEAKVKATQALDYGSFTFKKLYDEKGNEIVAERKVLASLTDEFSPLKNSDGTYYTFDGQDDSKTTTSTKGEGETLRHVTNIEAQGFEIEGNAYKIKMTDNFGKKKVAAIKFKKSQYFTSYGFYFDSIANYSEFEKDGYTITAERTFFSEELKEEALGRLYWVNVKKNGETYSPAYLAYGYDGDDYDYNSRRIIVRTSGTTTYVDKNGKEYKDWFVYTASTLFEVKLSATASATEKYPAYDNVETFNVVELSIAYDKADGRSFAEYVEENGEKRVVFWNSYLSLYYNISSVKTSQYGKEGNREYCEVHFYGDKKVQYVIFNEVEKEGEITTTASLSSVKPEPEIDEDSQED